MKNYLKQIFKPSLRYIYYTIPDYVKLGKKFRVTYNLLQESQYWSREKQNQHQLNMLQQLVAHSYRTVPYYRRLFEQINLKPDDIKSLDDIRKIPYLTKEIIRDNFNDLISEKYKLKDLRVVKTGGSTGEPLIFYVEDKKDRAVEWAHVSHLWNRVGYNVRSRNRRVILMGAQLKSLFQYKDKDLVMSSFKLTEENIPEYLCEMEKFRPKFIHCYPSSIFTIAKFILENDYTIDLKTLKAILCVSENLSSIQRKVIEKAFNTRVYSFYGHSEHACIAGECEESEFYHIEPFYGYTELIKDDQIVENENEIGEIVTTSLSNYAMPFIRYKTKDLAVNTNQKCNCGRNHKLIKKVEGREQEYILSKKGNKIMLTGSYKILHGLGHKIFSGQFYQDKQGLVILRIVPKASYKNQDAQYIFKEFYEKFGGEVELKLELVNSIERTKSGKYKFLIQKLPLE